MTPERTEETIIKILDGIGELKAVLGEVKTKLDADFRALHGNGQPGLVAHVQDMQERLAKLEERDRHRGSVWGVVAWLVNAAIALAAVILAYRR